MNRQKIDEKYTWVSRARSRVKKIGEGEAETLIYRSHRTQRRLRVAQPEVHLKAGGAQGRRFRKLVVCIRVSRGLLSVY